ncbi:aldo/keto reductase [Treponema endosymbiont of Eucomonympha sp.]|uniref:aldo/keto reductase n=1 Tax=Treponema endosymbiont of Eucomonympha sp. TaxID=1580831 RepID=UPI000781BC38|nr:aldo/keto reductase [Treponema endosymbiont of Eucomonympha sp.]
MFEKKLGFGLMRLPLKDPNDRFNVENVEMDTLKCMVDIFIERGFNYFDTAYVYGSSEAATNAALVKRYPRDSFRLATKLPLNKLKSSEDQEKFFDESLARCGVDYFDNYLLHDMSAENYKIACEFNSYDFIRTKKAEGKIKHIGFSFHDTAELLDEILTDYPDFEFVQLQINYLDWDNEGIQSRKCYETAVKHNKPVIVMEPVKGGTLANVPENAEKLLKGHNPNMSVPSWAIRYVASLDNVVTVLSGMSTLEQLNDNTDFMRDFIPLSDEERAILEQTVNIIAGNIAIPCTACRYCVDTCPQNIPIPDYFGLYNNKKQSMAQPFYVQDLYYQRRSQGCGKASDCVECGECEKHCPQHLTIRQFLKDVAVSFEKV